MQRSFSIITTCKGRLEHLKQTLPRMLEQGAAEVIVVDYSCPDGTAAWVGKHFPAARVVTVEGEQGFSNWRARNLGAAAATGDLLLFCDADTILAPNAGEAIAKALPPKTYGFFKRNATARFNKAGLRLGSNQLRGFHAIPAPAYRRLGGYDDVLRGWGAGGDTDLLALGAGSPAIDRVPGCIGTDQRDLRRPQGSACDAGQSRGPCPLGPGS